jgi:hypothetical protein
MSIINKRKTKAKYIKPVLDKYDTLSEITLASHVSRGTCKNYFASTVGLKNAASCHIGQASPGYKGGPNHDCCN